MSKMKTGLNGSSNTDMKRYLFLLVFFLFLLPDSPVLAHPGNTDALGCHTCRTNCSNWGLSYGEYHCHNNRGASQPEYPIHSTYGSGGTGYTTPAPDYAYPSAPRIPSCPLMSSFDSISGSCKCFSGYVVGTDFLGEQTCVSGDSECTKTFGSGARYDSISSRCECRYGYLLKGSRCISESTYCMDSLGLMSRYNSISEKCECMAGYEFNGSSCVYKSTYRPLPSLPNCPINSHVSLSDSSKCSCDSGYVLNTARDGCVSAPILDIPASPTQTKPAVLPAPAIKPEPKKSFVIDDTKLSSYKNSVAAVLSVAGNLRGCPSLECKLVRGITEGTSVSILADYDKGNWYKVEVGKESGWAHNSILKKLPQSSLDSAPGDISPPVTDPKKSIWQKFRGLFGR
jgi:hypothetical protein